MTLSGRRKKHSRRSPRYFSFGPLRFNPKLLIAALLVLAVAAIISQFFRPAEGQVTKVIDGDTIVVFMGGREERVRLLGIDPPEVRHPERGEEPFGREASTYTRTRLLGKKVRLRVDPIADDSDEYGRLLRLVELPGGIDFNAELVRKGYARALRRFPCSRKERYVALEREARRRELGMWGNGE